MTKGFMSEAMKNVNWEQYSHQGLKSPDFQGLIQDLSSGDELTRLKAMTELENQLEWAYEKAKNELPYDIIPVFIELLRSKDLTDKSVVTSLLLFLLSYSEYPELEEPYKSKAFRLKKCVCEGIDVYQSFLEDEAYKSLIQDKDTKEDFNELIECCNDK